MIMMEKVERAEREAAEVEEDEAMLPGFRFHPTDEELVGFYLRRKVQKKRLSIEIIKEMEIYKHEPWDLPNSGNVTTAGEKEWYFFCRRGRKYRNSVRPNRVTGCGFWKATGIDRPIHSSGRCIGLKKSLVYYRGHAGKGTKTDWMMHEFRLPSSSGETAAKNAASLQEAEVWTICRIFKRSGSYKKQPNSYRASAPTKSSPSPPEYSSSVTNCFDPDEYMCSGSSGGSPEAAAPELHVEDYNITAGEWSSASVGHDQPASWDQSPSSNDFAGDGFWEELGWIEQFLADDNYSLDNSNVNAQGNNYNATDHA